MGRISKTVQALFNGVSQQPPGLRLDSQVEEMVNMWPDIAQGITRRSPTAHHAELSWNIPQGFTSDNRRRHYTHKIDKSVDERYIAHFSIPHDGSAYTPRIDVVDPEGTEYPVIYDTTAARNYIESATVGGDFRAVSVLDTTFIVNTSVTPAMTSALSQWGENLVSDTFKWTLSGSGTNEYYVELAQGSQEDTDDDGVPDGPISYNPSLARPEEVLENNVEISEGTLGSLAAGEWAYGDNDTLGYSTVYVRLTDGTDPDTKASGYVFMKNTSDFAYIHFTQSTLESDSISLEIDGKSTQRHVGGDESLNDGVTALLNCISDLSSTGIQGRPTGAGVNNYSSCVRLTKEVAGVNEDFKIKISDYPWLKLVKNQVDKFTDLPAQGREGDILEVTGEAAESSGAPYYVRYEEDTGRWVESLPDGLAYEINATTMPHKMTRMQDDGAGTVTGTPNQLYFFVEAIDWVDRAVGDNNSNPLPSFIGTPIEDVFFYQNRLGFASGENIIMSQSSEYFNFFAQTTTEVLDDDPIDVTIGTNSAVTIKWVFPFTNSLELIGTNRQFSLHSGTSNPALTPQNVVVDPTTSLEPLPDVRPVSMGYSLFIATARNSLGVIFRYTVDPEGITTRALDITKHVPTYIPHEITEIPYASVGPIEHLEICEETQTLFVCNSGQNSDVFSLSAQVFVYSMFEQGGELVQSAWHKWTLPAISLHVFNAVAYLDCLRATSSSIQAEDSPWEVHVESLTLNPEGHNSSPVYSLQRDYIDGLREVVPTSADGATNTILSLPFQLIEESLSNNEGVLTFTAYKQVLASKETGRGVTEYHDQSFDSESNLGGGTYQYTWDNQSLDHQDVVYFGYSYESYVDQTEVSVKQQEGVKVGRIIHLFTSICPKLGDYLNITASSRARNADISNRDFSVLADKNVSTSDNPKVSVHLPADDAVVRIKSTTYRPLTIKAISWVANYINHSRTL